MRWRWMLVGLSGLAGCYGGPATLPTALVGDNRISSTVFEAPSASPYYAGGPSAPGTPPPLGLGAFAAAGNGATAAPAPAMPGNTPQPLVGPVPAAPPSSSPPIATPDPVVEERRAERDADLRTAKEPPLKVPEPAGFTSGTPNPGAAFGAAANRSGAIGRLFSAVSSSDWETARAPAASGFSRPPPAPSAPAATGNAP